MADLNTSLPAAPAAPSSVTPTIESSAAAPEAPKQEPLPSSAPTATSTAKPDAPPEKNASSDELAAASADVSSQKHAVSDDVEMKDAAEPAQVQPAANADETAAAQANEPVTMTPSDKSKSRRKSTGAADKNKKLNKKASKAKITHLDAKPGDHFFVKLKGFPQWPAIICDEDMLPQALIKSRPVTAIRPDGTYRDDYADGGKRASERTFPVMYLHTNEFGWVPNTDLLDLDPATVMDVKMDKMRKDLQAAYELASHNHSLSHYKDVLQKFQDDLMEQTKAKEAKAATPAKKSKKAKAEAEDDDDVNMNDVADDEETAVKEKKNKKRKVEENEETPQRSDSVKKPKIKLTNSSAAKAANGSGTSKSSKSQGDAKPAKTKTKKPKAAEESKQDKETATPKEPELSPEALHVRKEKEVLFLRHKLQKGLLTRDQTPKEDEMKAMSDYVTKLEAFPDLEVSIIRATKINKVLKAILKLESIPKEDEFKFKSRSQVLLEKWTKLLAVDETPKPAAAEASANGVNGTASDTKTNGVKEKASDSAEPAKVAPKAEEPSAPAAEKPTVEKPADEQAAAEKPVEDEAKAPAVEASA